MAVQGGNSCRSRPDWLLAPEQQSPSGQTRASSVLQLGPSGRARNRGRLVSFLPLRRDIFPHRRQQDCEGLAKSFTEH